MSRKLGAIHRNEILNGEITSTMKVTKIIIEAWRQRFNMIILHTSLSYQYT